MTTSFYTEKELTQIGFKEVGKNVLISRYAQFYGASDMIIGNNVRIDDFCILSGKIKLGSYIHISAYNALYGKFGIEMEDYTGLSPRCTLFSATDDFSGEYLIGPTIDSKYTNVTGGKIIIKKYSQLGSNCVVLPEVTIEEGVAVGAMSLINKNLSGWGIYKGIPAKLHSKRSNKLLNLLINEY
ncbi:acyltransferase [Prolixibacter bellariivorans]|nr:galactoside O-acetyltransferase [Prolixibacter bellariivorans]